MKNINVIGAGLAGAEACNFLLKHGVHVTLFEMRPAKMSEAHHTELFAELVCSNSLKNNALDNACGLLKEEMRHMSSITMESAAQSCVPSGWALSVDRNQFSSYITKSLKNNKELSLIVKEIDKIPDGITIVATGPLTSKPLVDELSNLTGINSLSFFDASAPIINKSSIDMNKVFIESRYDQGGGYINCPLSKEEYYHFVDELINAKLGIVHSFDQNYFEGCMPIEVMAKRGRDTLRFGPLSPKGFNITPEPFAVVQLRQDDLIGDIYNMVGFQTNLTYSEQKRVFSLIPGLEKLDIIRYGLMHKNVFLKSPKVLNNDFSLKNNPNIFIAGQLSGVEGYVESAATGIVVAINALKRLNGSETSAPPLNTMIGSLMNYVVNSNPVTFSPMNANYSIFYNKKHLSKDDIAKESIEAISKWYMKNE